MSDLRVFSSGGGVQSTAALVLAAQGRIDYPVFLFANVGDDSENPGTPAYFKEYARPFASEHGIELIELRRRMRTGEERTLRQEIDHQPRSVPIPVRLAGGGFGRRKCTDRFKVQVIGRWTKEHGATPEFPAIVGIGFSTDEFERATNATDLPWQAKTYPLLDLRISRSDCVRIIADAGLPQPPKSACTFCPFHSVEDWRRQARETPDIFADSVALEARLNDRRLSMGKDRAWFSSAMAPLPVVLDQGDLFSESEITCDAGSCFT